MPKKGQKMSKEQRAKIKTALSKKKESKEEVVKAENVVYVFKQRVSWNDRNFEIGDENKPEYEGHNDMIKYCKIKE